MEHHQDLDPIHVHLLPYTTMNDEKVVVVVVVAVVLPVKMRYCSMTKEVEVMMRITQEKVVEQWRWMMRRRRRNMLTTTMMMIMDDILHI
jgi:hypothetical protein